MLIGILTFHWATNYGAVLQTYALQTALRKYGAQATVIDYYPKRLKPSFAGCFYTRHQKKIKKNILQYIKEKRIERFRRSRLHRTAYCRDSRKINELENNFDCYICGSDQVWNEWFVRKGNKRTDFVYFLDFVPADKIIASYAASFGTAEYPADLLPEVRKNLERFDFLSLRENSGLELVRTLGFENACLVPDPTLLLEKDDYKQLINRNEPKRRRYAFSYILHDRENDAKALLEAISENNIDIRSCAAGGISDWLSCIYYSDIVITNSFHGIVFSIIFEKPFVAILIKKSGMNDRIITLLSRLGLENRIYRGDASVISENIDWNIVAPKLEAFRNEGKRYIQRILSYKKEQKNEG